MRRRGDSFHERFRAARDRRKLTLDAVSDRFYDLSIRMPDAVNFINERQSFRFPTYFLQRLESGHFILDKGSIYHDVALLMGLVCRTHDLAFMHNKANTKRDKQERLRWEDNARLADDVAMLIRDQQFERLAFDPMARGAARMRRLFKSSIEWFSVFYHHGHHYDEWPPKTFDLWDFSDPCECPRCQGALP